MADANMDDDDDNSALHAVIQIPVGLPFEMPKDIDVGDNLLWTRQIDALAQEVDARKGLSGVADSCFILAGPLGVGKSCIALSLALHLRANGEAVLYVNDAGELVETVAEETGWYHREMPGAFRSRLSRLFREQNSTNFPDLKSLDFETTEELVGKLNEMRSVVIIDEQGTRSAWTKLSGPPLSFFPFISSNSWINNGRFVRIVLTGSNQAAFQTALNGTYTGCLRYIVPLHHDEAKILNTANTWNLENDDLTVYCNCIPREMKKLSRNGNAESYMLKRATEISRNLHKVFLEDERYRYDKEGLAHMLRYLFRDRSLYPGVALVPFIDLGFVYRVETPEAIQAFPLCRAAERALLELWTSVDPSPPKSLSECIRLSKGDDFELLVFHTLVQRLVRPNALLPCNQLGAIVFVENIPITLDAVHTATCGSSDDEVIADIGGVRHSAARHDQTVLYHCPKNTKTIFVSFPAAWSL